MSYREFSYKRLLQKSEDSFKSAEALLPLSLYQDAVSRLYYSAFNNVRAIMSYHDESSKKHEGVRQWVNLNLCKTGKLSPELCKMYNKLMNQRADADYTEGVEFEEHEVSGLLEQVREFNRIITELCSTENTT